MLNALRVDAVEQATNPPPPPPSALEGVDVRREGVEGGSTNPGN